MNITSRSRNAIGLMTVSLRRDGNEAFKKLEKSEDLSEDLIAELQDDLQKATDKRIKEIDKAVEEKSKELMKV